LIRGLNNPQTPDGVDPLDPLIPNATTIAVMKESRAGKLPSANTIKGLKKALYAED
jgi:DNA-damage-inducible protein J